MAGLLVERLTRLMRVRPQVIYRIHRAERPVADFSGAQRYGARWNAPGIPMLYAADSLALAMLEVLVHLKEQWDLPKDRYVWSKAKVDGSLPDLHADPHNQNECRKTGAAWVGGNSSAAARVRSVVCPEHHNVLLNPRHDGFQKIRWEPPVPFVFDSRLFYRSDRDFR